MKADLHVHSKHSKRPSQWILQKIGCPESFTEPHLIYQIAKKRGMDLVTITDHNSIDGALEIAHLPDTFISEEITTYFPQDGCKIHVLALRISEDHHREIQKVRSNVFELAAYLFQEKIPCIAAHPLYAVNDRLTIGHFEQMLLLFDYFELNGARGDEQNRCLEMVLANLQACEIEHLQDKYNFKAHSDRAWEKTLTGGSDDHSGLNIARTYTEVFETTDIETFFANLGTRKTKVTGLASTPLTMAHNLYAIAYQFYHSKFNLGRHTSYDRLLNYLDRSLRPAAAISGGLLARIYLFLNHRKRDRLPAEIPETLMDLIRRETDKLLSEDRRLGDIAQTAGDTLQEREQKWFAFVNQVSNKVLSHSANHLLGHLSGANVFNIFQTIGSAGGLYALLAPFFVSFIQFRKDRDLNSTILKRYTPYHYQYCQKTRTTRVAHFTDTFYDVNGVAQTLQQQVKSARQNNKELTIITCGTNNQTSCEGIQNFSHIGIYQIPEYPEQRLCCPPFLEMLNYCYEQKFTHIQSATPGPVGLAALAIAKILKLPINGTYHTAFPQYAKYLTGDTAIEEMTWKYMVWYYDQMDHIFVSSQNSAEELMEKGIRAEKIRLFPRVIDTDLFHPQKRNGVLQEKFLIEEGLILLYVGRISREKNLPMLARAFMALNSSLENLHMIIVGDGPFLPEMKQMMRGSNCTFTGYLKGEELSAVYASSDIFVFPSTTDTFGNVVLEAQASGLPVIVSDQGGPCEIMVPGKTGLVVPGNDQQGLAEAIELLAVDPLRRIAMGVAAREFVEERSFESAFMRSWEMLEEEMCPGEDFLFKTAI